MQKVNNENISLNFCLLVFVLILGFQINDSKAKAKDQNPIEMKVVLTQTAEKEFFLDISLTNKANLPISLYQDDLPWEFRYSLQVLAVKAFLAEGILEESLPVVDRGGSKVVHIQPGETLQGMVSLNKRFHTLPQVVEKRDIIIFWTYQLELVDGSQLDRVGGWLLIPKQSP